MSPWITPAVSGGVGVICLVVAAAIWILGGRHTPRLVVFFAIAGTVGLLGTGLGKWLQGRVDWLADGLGRVAGGMFGPAIAGAAVLVVAYVVVLHLWQRRVNDRTIFCAAGLPLVATLIPGVIGAAIATATFAAGNALGWGVGALFGLN